MTPSQLRLDAVSWGRLRIPRTADRGRGRSVADGDPLQRLRCPSTALLRSGLRNRRRSRSASSRRSGRARLPAYGHATTPTKRLDELLGAPASAAELHPSDCSAHLLLCTVVAGDADLQRGPHCEGAACGSTRPLEVLAIASPSHWRTDTPMPRDIQPAASASPPSTDHLWRVSDVAAFMTLCENSTREVIASAPDAPKPIVTAGRVRLWAPGQWHAWAARRGGLAFDPHIAEDGLPSGEEWNGVAT